MTPASNVTTRQPGPQRARVKPSVQPSRMKLPPTSVVAPPAKFYTPSNKPSNNATLPLVSCPPAKKHRMTSSTYAPVSVSATQASSSSKTNKAKTKPSCSSGKPRQGSQSGRAKAKLKVSTINPDAIERLEVIPHCDGTLVTRQIYIEVVNVRKEPVPLEKGKHNVRIYPGTLCVLRTSSMRMSC